MTGGLWVYGWHAIESILQNRSRKIFKILAKRATFRKAEQLMAFYKTKIDIEIADEKFTPLFGTAVHQGIAAYVSQINFYNLPDWLSRQSGHSTLIACDQIVDPQNLGAIIRHAAVFNMSGVMITKMHSAAFKAALTKSAAGALEIVPIITVSNLATALTVLKKNYYMIFGLDEDGQLDWPITDRNVVVIGQEGAGMRELTKRTCDVILRINTGGKFTTLNASSAAAIAMYKFFGMSK